MNIYTVIMLITALILAITAADVLTNRLVSPKNKREIIAICILILISGVCEYIGKMTNGAAAEFIGLHNAAKIIEFCTAPCISIAAANAFGKLVHKKLAVGLLAAHAIFELAAYLGGWVFVVDGNNIYHREELYWVYIATFAVSIVACYICLIRGNRRYQAQLGLTNALILFFLSFGIGIQMIYSDVAVDFMCVAIGNFFLYHHRGTIVNQVDVTTRLLNRRCYERSLENAKSPSYVLIFDIDKFKSINDSCGHDEGDRFLENVAKIILSIYGKVGLCYRIGGDEFCVILHKNIVKIQTYNRLFKEATEELRTKDGKKVGVSFGYAYYDEKKGTISSAIKKADEMMYENKAK